MSIYVWFVVILVTALVTFWVANLVTRPGRIPVDRLADPAPLPGELPIAGRLELDEPFDLPSALILSRLGTPIRAGRDPYGPFPVDTGPLLILSDKMAANVALEREIEQRCAEAEAKIPPRWR